jgi:hypothetical protein
VAAFRTIPGSVKVRGTDPLLQAPDRVAARLAGDEVFAEVVVVSSAHSVAEDDLELLVDVTVEDDSHFPAELVKAVFRGLLLSLADGAFADKYDDQVTLDATLRRGDLEFGDYRAIASCHAQEPENADTALESAARAQAWDHALALLSAEIRMDARAIEEALGQHEASRHP